MKRITSCVRKAVETYDMIQEGDKVAVGISGGKDSLVLLGAMANLSRYTCEQHWSSASVVEVPLRGVHL